jgi:flagellar basal-body rod modification protein FlgD
MTTTSATAVAGSAGFAATTGKTTSKTSIANNFDQFLSLLTTQLKNQSPLDPLDTNQFTQQLVQFASVEQQLKQNETLTTLLAVNKSMTATAALGYVGSTIRADGVQTQLKAGRAEWSLDSARPSDATITIKNASGSVVATDRRSLSAGPNAYVWNGRTSTGANAPEGAYKIEVSARDSLGQQVLIKNEIVGVVDSVDLSGDAPLLKIGALTVELDKIKSLSRN